MAFTIKQNDTSPALQATLKDYAGVAVNLLGASVKFHLKSVDGMIKVDAPMTIQSTSGGIVVYSWEVGDTDTSGTYYAEFQVTYSDLSVETFPNTGSLAVLVVPELK